ncbi:hypothetical protein HJ526_14770 [Donghicola sp. C2-DW-16]|uniref:Uncharacterized protein n=1 Tax=Donghicola mangrovi TaxID=2729614 RepID=A0ABX2PGR6_9RHOB|nr:hypothetical protein [Donghicola mangrovi]NVO28691.1 hypothetical protein [Donghicola mangrovi]
MDLPHIQFDSLFKMPWSGNIVQDIRPEFFSSSYSGVPDIEAKVITDVAGYGRQLGWISNALMVLVEQAGPFSEKDEEKIAKLRELVADVADIKESHRTQVRARAASALDTLRIVDPESYADLIARRTK